MPTLEIHQIHHHCSKPPLDEALDLQLEEDGEDPVEYIEYDLVDSVSLVSETDISAFTAQEITD